jgi:vancomycin resistance protein VanW
MWRGRREFSPTSCSGPGLGAFWPPRLNDGIIETSRSDDVHATAHSDRGPEAASAPSDGGRATSRRPALDELDALGRVTRRAAVAALSAKRLALWRLRPGLYPTPLRSSNRAAFVHLLREVEVPLRRYGPDVDPVLDAGKAENVRRAARALDGVIVTPDRPFSFWRTVGPLTEKRGYVSGMELRGGCVVPAVGGGVCLMSNALFGLVATAGFDILERHGHTVELPNGADGVWGLDATLFYPYVDLRFAPTLGSCRIEALVESGTLFLRLWSDQPSSDDVEIRQAFLGLTGDLRVGALIRRRRPRAGGPIRDELLLVDRKTVAPGSALRRNCMNCGLTTCASRVEAVLPRVDGAPATMASPV